MLKKTIVYTDYEGNEREENFYFNLTKAEVMAMEMGTTGGMTKMIEKIIAEQDSKRLIETFKDIILRSFGEKSPDGKRFEKIRDGHRLAEDFVQTEAYSELFMELVGNADAAAAFINGIVPQNLTPSASAPSAR